MLRNLFAGCIVWLICMSVAAQNKGVPLRIMSYNIRYDNPGDGENQWGKRKDRVSGLLSFYEPDVFGVQEALLNQLDDLQAALPGYTWYGAGRDDGKDKGEFSAVFYKKDRFDLLDKGTFWLAPDPSRPGKGWDAAIVRVCSWVKLRDKGSRESFFLFNTHFDHVGEEARRESAKLILSRIQAIAGNTPALLTGDLNTAPGSVAYRTLAKSPALRDAKDVSQTPHYGPDASWATFDVKHGLGDRIDYIFVTPGVKVLRHAILTDSQNLSYPSDHLPVFAGVVLGK